MVDIASLSDKQRDIETEVHSETVYSTGEQQDYEEAISLLDSAKDVIVSGYFKNVIQGVIDEIRGTYNR